MAAYTVYWALSIKPSTFFTQTRFHVPTNQWAKHTKSSSLQCNHSHQDNSEATSFPKCQPCTMENLSTCLFFHLKQEAEVVSWQQTHKKPFVSFCSLTRIMDPLLCTSQNYILIHPSTSITVQCYEKLLRKGRSHEDFFLTLSKMKLEASFSFLTLPVPHSPPQI